SLTQEEFIKAPGSFGGDPVRAAQNLPGVAATGGSAQIIVQGASPEDTGYLINGHRVPLVFHFGGLSSVIIPEAVERVDLLPSGYGPEYSKAIGGIIGLTTKLPKEDRVHGMAYIDLLNSGGLIEGPIDEKSSFLVSGRYSYIGQVLKAVAKENDDFELTAAPTYYDFTSIYKRKINEKNDFKTTFIFSKDELELILNQPANNDPGLRGEFYNRTEFFRIIPQLTTTLNARHKMDNSLAIGKDSIFVNISGRYLDVNSNVISHRSELVSEWKPTYKTYLGLDNQWSDSKVGINLPTTYSVGGVGTPFSVGEEQRFTSDERQTQLGAYLRQEIKTSEDSKWTYLPNLRVDHFTHSTETHLQPRFQLRHQLQPSLLLRGAWGKYVQPPRPQESSSRYGNADVTSPYAYHYMLGYTKDFRENSNQGLEFTNNYFYKELNDLVIPDVQKRYDNDGSGTIVGGEVQAKYRKNEWSSQVVYTYLKSRRHIPGYGTRPSEFDQTHNLNLIGTYNKERWTFSGRFRFVSGMPYTPVNGATFDSDNDVYIPNAGSIYSQRFDSFKQFDIRIDRKYIYEKWILTAYLDIQNVTNSPNSQNIEYSYDYSENKKVRGLPILPTFGIKGEF
nr:TonB-dependent receptor plug domain-containing protein [Bdellovibrionales bacterium]